MRSTEVSLDFVHLHVHSAYSLLEGALPIEQLATLAKQDQMPALALTDRNNLFGALEFSECLSKSGIQPIVGCTLAVNIDQKSAPNRADKEDIAVPQAANGTLVLLAQNEMGYANLMRLSSDAFLSSGEALPHINEDQLQCHHHGLICLTGGPDGVIDQALSVGDERQARLRLEALGRLFGDRLYVELQRHRSNDPGGGERGVGEPAARRIEKQLISLAFELGLPLVASNEPYFACIEDYEAHDALICIAEGRYVTEDDRRRLSPDHFFKTRSEMVALFSDLPEALESTVEIARRCAFCPQARAPILPQFVRTRGDEKAEDIFTAECLELQNQAEAGLKLRLDIEGSASGKSEDDYWRRLSFELEVIRDMKFPGYFLIVADFIKWAKSQDIPVGPGRGSGAGSVVAWALTITDLDPLRFGLLFERFLNPERISMPDFDIDFCQDRRDDVIHYVQEKYGADRVAQIITFGKLQARAVLRDVGRVLHMPYRQVDRFCKLVPNNPANPVTLAEAIRDEPKLREARDAEPIVAKLLNIGGRLEGLYRHASTHAAGVVIADRPLTELVPLYHDPRAGLSATQFNMKWVEQAGLVKFDFLGLKTLTVIEITKRRIAENGGAIDFATLPLDDKATYEMIARGETIGVFQLEGSGMRESLRKLSPDRFEDIIAMVALYRPGPMDNIETYINRKFGREDPNYLHPLIQPILEETYGVIIYQEQVMQVAQKLSGYSLGEADLLRRAMGKKIRSEMNKQKKRFIDGAVEKGVEKSRAQYIFELVAKFAGYGFNKSHAAAYAMLAYQTAYLKANHRVEFLAASMSLDMGNTDKLNIFVQEAKRSNIEILAPSVHHSHHEFLPEGKGIRYALSALKNIGQQAVEHICEVRDEGGAFQSLDDFASRVSPRIVNKRGFEALAASGAFDDLEPDRAKIFGNVDILLGAANRALADRVLGQNDLFTQENKPQAIELREVESWLPMEKLTRELEAVGFFLSGHPLDDYVDVLSRLGVQSWRQYEEKIRAGEGQGLLAGTVTTLQERTSKSGNRYAFARFSDSTGQFEAVIFSDTLALSGELLTAGKPVLLRVEGELDGDQIKTRVHSVDSLDHAAMKARKGLRVNITHNVVAADFFKQLEKSGSGDIYLCLTLEEIARHVEIKLPGRFDISPNQVSILKSFDGVMHIEEF